MNMVPWSFFFKPLFKKSRSAAGSFSCMVFFMLLLFYSNSVAQFWSVADSAFLTRHSSTTILLQDARVLKVGGFGVGIGNWCQGSVQCEIFDPSTNSWSYTDSMDNARAFHSAVLLQSGEVLVMGGGWVSGCYTASVEKYDPNTGNWLPMPSMNFARSLHTSTLLKDGRVLVIGGSWDGTGAGISCEIFDPSDSTWTLKDPMALERRWHTATLLPNGKILVDGGMQFTGQTPRTEIFDPIHGTWSPAYPDPIERVAHGATLLPNGLVLVVGGNTPGTVNTLTDCALYDYTNNTWFEPSPLNFPHDQHGQVLLPNGTVLVMGGDSLAQCEIFDPGDSTWTVTDSLSSWGNQKSNVLLPDGRVLDVSGYKSSVTEIYDYKIGSWSNVGSMTVKRSEYSLTSLPTGDVLISGGATTIPFSGTPVATCELFNSSTGMWNPTGAMDTARAFHASVLLPNGKVLAIGGAVSNLSNFGGIPTASCEIYDPLTGNWDQTGALNFARANHTATLLYNGKVLVVGGGG